MHLCSASKCTIKSSPVVIARVLSRDPFNAFCRNKTWNRFILCSYNVAARDKWEVSFLKSIVLLLNSSSLLAQSLLLQASPSGPGEHGDQGSSLGPCSPGAPGRDGFKPIWPILSNWAPRLKGPRANSDRVTVWNHFGIQRETYLATT